MSEIQSQIEADRRRLEEQQGMQEEEKNRIEKEVADKEEELRKHQYVSVCYSVHFFILTCKLKKDICKNPKILEVRNLESKKSLVKVAVVRLLKICFNPNHVVFWTTYYIVNELKRHRIHASIPDCVELLYLTIPIYGKSIAISHMKFGEL